MSERGRDCGNCKLAVNLKALNLSIFTAKFISSAFCGAANRRARAEIWRRNV
ncbi:hypothetical protein CAMSH0001_0769 [Campylobacter showae RM3277]|uniref:Uncharacterized protein n=1 Tax=Campylobacter showae RM3277 TaxID=553219 RepID=C6RHE2_9BACT|nr:hypothetical protein CAMSH0001_0769 [Campylobacter showae RM3277]